MYVLSKVSKQWQRLLYFLVCNSQMSLIFCEASEYQVKNVKATLICFEAVSGLKVNFFFSKANTLGLKLMIPIFINLLLCLAVKRVLFPLHI